MTRVTAAAALIALLAAGVASGASGQGAGAKRHLVSVANDGRQAAALEGTGARVVARYEEFTLVEADRPDAVRLVRAGASSRDELRTVRIGERTLDPSTRPSLDAAPPRGTSLALLQFVGPVKDAWLARVRRTGVRVVTYMAQNGYLVHGSAAELRSLAARLGRDPALRAVAPYTAADKLADDVPATGRSRLVVQTLSGADGSGARREAGVKGRRLRATTAVGPLRTQYLVLEGREATELARDPGVVAIERAPVPRLRDERQAQILAGNLSGPDPLVPTAPGYLGFQGGIGLGTTTFPFAVDVTDEGLDAGSVDTTHPDFHEEGDVLGPTRLSYVDDFTSDLDGKDCGGHGTINASIAGGFSSATGDTGPGAVEDAQGFNHGLGVAPRTLLGGSKIFRCSDGGFDLLSSFTALTTSAYGKGARISSNSWGADVQGAYDVDSQEYDALVRDADPVTPGNQEMVEVFASGNDGAAISTVGSPGTAKNVITVGASEGVRASGLDGCAVSDLEADDARDIPDFSSRGPTEDGRIKPDLVAPGTHVTGAQPQHAEYTGSGVCDTRFPGDSTLYSLSSGTSHSTPAVSGMAALVREWYREVKGGGTEVPSAALTKSILVSSAASLEGGDNGAGGTTGHVPNVIQGWGLPNIAAALDGGPRWFRDQQDTFGDTGEGTARTFAIADTSKPVRVTLAWTDAPGPVTGASYVNDLDLTAVRGPVELKGNRLANGVSVPGGSADLKNNVESVILPAGTSGDLIVEVTAANVAGDGVPGNADLTDQDFAITVTNANEVTGEPPTVAGLEATGGPDSITLDWDNEAAATGYEIFRMSGSTPYSDTPTATAGTSAYVDSPLSAGTERCYRVRAVNAAGSGRVSDEACATPGTDLSGGGGSGGGGGGGGGGGAATGGSGSGTSKPKQLLDLSVAAGSVRVDRRRRFRLSLRGTPRTAGSLRLVSVRRFGSPARRLALLRRSFTTPQSGRATLRLRISRRAMRRLQDAGRLRVTVRVRLGSLFASRRITLRAGRR